MAGEWPVVRLGDVVDLVTGFPFESQQYTNDPTAPRLLRGDNVGQGVLRWDGAKRWPATGTGDLGGYWLREGDVILAMDRPWIEAGLKYAAVRDSDLPALLVQRVARLRGTAQLHTGFLKYVIGGRGFTEYITGVQTGTAVPHISGGQIRSYEFPLPPLPQQRAIAHILGTLDDKIELNRRMNETLVAIARALFKSWFVDFDSVRAKSDGRDPGLPGPLADLFPISLEASELGDIPQGWVVKPVGDLADVVGGTTPSTETQAYWRGGTHPWATPRDLSSLSVPVLLSTDRRITDVGLSQVGSGLLPKGTVLMSSRAPIGYLAVAEMAVAINQGFIALKPRAETSNLFLLFWASVAQGQIISRANGSTFLEISKANFRSIPVVTPPLALMQVFDGQTRPYYERIVANEREAQALVAMRNTLLPRLLSSEARTPHAVRGADDLRGLVDRE